MVSVSASADPLPLLLLMMDSYFVRCHKLLSPQVALGSGLIRGASRTKTGTRIVGYLDCAVLGWNCGRILELWARKDSLVLRG